MRPDKYARIFHRLVTGLTIAKNCNAYMRFMTLTSAKQQNHPIKKSFDILRKRIHRATYEKDGFQGFKFNRYFSLRTSEGNTVLHIIYWGRYIPQKWLSKTWHKIHGAKIVDIRKTYSLRRKVNGLVNYLLRRYLMEQPIKRMSYGWRWAWLGFCKSWKNLKEIYGHMRKPQFSSLRLIGTYIIRYTMYFNPSTLTTWGISYIVPNYTFQGKYSNQTVQAWQHFLDGSRPSTYMTKLTKYT